MNFETPQYTVEDLQLEALAELLFFDPSLASEISQVLRKRMEDYCIDDAEVLEFLDALKGDYSLQQISEIDHADNRTSLEQKISHLNNLIHFLKHDS